MKITEKRLRMRLDSLNKRAGFDNPPYSTIGAYCLDYAYGGVQLQQYSSEGGAVRDIFRNGFMPKRELYNLICAYETGLTER